MSLFKTDPAEVEKEHGINSGNAKSDWYKITEGDQRLRILTPMEVMVSHFTKNPAGYGGICIGKDFHCPGCKRDDEIKAENETILDAKLKKPLTRNIKWLVWVLDYGALDRMAADPKLFEDEFKLAKLPHTVAKMLKGIQENPEYKFDALPMPYDITLSAKGAGTTNVEYGVTPARKDTPIPEDLVPKLQKITPPEVIIQKMKDKKKRDLGMIPAEDTVEQERAPLPPGTPIRGYEYPKEDIDPNDIPF